MDQRDDETVDELLNGRLRIAQRKRGYRFSIDALLLAHFAVVHEGDDLIDLGTGSGVIALILAGRCDCGRVLGIDIQEELLAIAKRNVALNGFSGRVEVLQGDVRYPERFCEPRSFAVAVFNPPYWRLMSGRMNPHPEKAVARHEISGKAEDFIAAAAYALRPAGRLYAIYPAGRMVHLIAMMRAHRVEPKRMCLVHSRRSGPGEFVLLEGVKGGREGLKMLPPLFIYEEEGGYTPEMAALFRSL